MGNDIDGKNPGDLSGHCVALWSNGAAVAIGALVDNVCGIDAGHVRVYINASGGWEQRGSDLDGLAAGDDFGLSVSLSANGNILAAGANLGAWQKPHLSFVGNEQPIARSRRKEGSKQNTQQLRKRRVCHGFFFVSLSFRHPVALDTLYTLLLRLSNSTLTTSPQ